MTKGFMLFLSLFFNYIPSRCEIMEKYEQIIVPRSNHFIAVRFISKYAFSENIYSWPNTNDSLQQ